MKESVIHVERQFTDSQWSWKLIDKHTEAIIDHGTGKTYNQALDNAMVAYRNKGI